MVNKRFNTALNSTGVLVAVILVLFSLHWLFMFSHMSTLEPYDRNGGWLTIPGFLHQVSHPDDAITRAFYRLNAWDGHWYHHIAENGYVCEHMPEQNNPFICNVAFFPMVSILGKMLSASGMTLVFSLPVSSQVFWLLGLGLFLVFVRSVSQIRLQHLVILSLLVTYPGALYAFTPYSEVILTFLLLSIAALSHWHIQRPAWRKIALLCVACFVVALTKISGVFALLIPLVMALLHFLSRAESAKRTSAMLLLPCVSGALGLLIVFLYLEYNFGDWALYFRYVTHAWANTRSDTITADILVVFTSFRWHDYLPVRYSNVIMVLSLAFFFILGYLSYRFRGRIPPIVHALLITAFVYYFFYTVIGHTAESVHHNLTRRMFPVFSIILLALSIMINQIQCRKFLRYIMAGAGMVAVTNLYFQHRMFEIFAIGRWVS